MDKLVEEQSESVVTPHRSGFFVVKPSNSSSFSAPSSAFHATSFSSYSDLRIASTASIPSCIPSSSNASAPQRLIQPLNIAAIEATAEANLDLSSNATEDESLSEPFPPTPCLTPELPPDVKEGDLIIFKNHYYCTYDKASDGYEDPYVDHIAIVAAVSGEKIDLIHSISSTKGHYHPQKQSGLCRTTLKGLKQQIQGAEEVDGIIIPPRMYDVSFHVYSCRNAQITERALKILKQQERVRLPYDEQRLNAKLALENQGLDDAEFLEFGKKQYLLDGRYRAIKFAARYPMPWTRTRQDGVGRGVTCSMAIILAFQVAELLEKNLVVTGQCTEEGWVSDKFGTLSKPQSKYSPKYLAYLKRLRHQDDGIESLEEQSRVSADFWRGDMPIEAFQHEYFPIDSKCTGAGGNCCIS